MWIILFVLCFRVIGLTNAEKAVNADVREELQPNQGVELDYTGQPMIYSIRNGLPDSEYNSQDTVSGDDQTLFYSNEWRPFVITDDFNHFINRSGYETESRIFLRRPDSELNKREFYDIAENGQLTTTQLPSAAIFLYPHPVNFHHNGNNEEGNIAVKNSATLAPLLSLSDSATSSPAVNRSEIFRSENVSKTNDDLEITDPLDFYRNTQELITPRVLAYMPPYPVFPFKKFQSLQPVPDSSFNRDSSPETTTNIPLINYFSEVESRYTSDSMHFNEAVENENVPNKAPLDMVPLPPSYPFGMIPVASFMAPLVSNVLPFKGQPLIPNGSITRGGSFILSATSRELSIRPPPFPKSKNSQAENKFEDTLLPLTVEKSPLESTTFVPQLRATSQTDVLQQQEGKTTYIKNESQKFFQEQTTTESIMPYEFGYDLKDGHGTDQHRKESLDRSGVVTGSYGYRDVFGVYRLVKYIADKDGFRASVKSNEPGVTNSVSADVEIMAERPSTNPPIPETTKAPETDDVVVEVESPDLVNPGI